MNKWLRTRGIDIVCFILAPMALAFSLANIEARVKWDALGYDYYNVVAELTIACSTGLICLGFLRKHWQRNPLP